MSRLPILTRCASLWLITLGIVLASGRPAAADETPSANVAEGPLLIAQLPPKPETEKHELRYKLKRGEVLRYEVSDRASFNTTIEQSTMATQTKTVTVKALKVVDVLPDGNIEFLNVLERVHMVNQLPDHEPTEFDSARDKTPPPGFEDVAKSIGVPLVAITMTPHGKVVRRNWKIRAPQAEENAPIAVRLPDGPVAVGDTWDEPYDVQVTLENQAAKLIQTRRHHKLANVSRGIATIEVTYQVLSPIDAYVEYQLLQRLMEGEVRFDIGAGRVISQQMDIDKRILGFAGPTSSTHYIMRMEEKLLETQPKVAAKPAAQPTTSQGPAKRGTQTRSANGPRPQQRTRTTRR
jgi:hypothetical protein